MSDLHFLGWFDTKESMLMMNAQQQAALLRRLLEGRDDELLSKIYGRRPVRDVYDPVTRGQSGKNVVLPFFDR